MDKEFIICAAIWFDDGKEYPHQPKNIETGFVIAGHRHHNCFTTMGILTSYSEEKVNYEKSQGFLTNTNRYVDRYEGQKIALAADQVLDIDGLRGGRLYSEDLY